jgi:hypothetical protein
MNINQLVQFLLTSSTIETITSDPYWNEVILLCKFDKETNTKGLPFYRDYSKYQYQVRELIGTNIESNFRIFDYNTANYPTFPSTSDISVESYGYINNRTNHISRIAEINSNIASATITPSYLEILQNGNDYHSLGNSEWSIEFSFFADEVSLPWSYQTIFHVGSCLQYVQVQLNVDNIATVYTPYTPNSGSAKGYGVFLDRNDLVFITHGTSYKINTVNIVRKTWYHVALQRIGNELRCFVNNQLTNTYSFNHDLTLELANNENTYENRLRIGSHLALRPRDGTAAYFSSAQSIDTSFSGGISNLRLTKAARYPQSFYSIKLPFLNSSNQNKIDDYYDETLFNIPLNYDRYDYSQNLAHFTNQSLLRQSVPFSTGFLYIDGINTLTTKNIPVTFNSDEFTLEFFLAPYVNSSPYYLSDDASKQSLIQLFFETYNIDGINGQFEREITLLKLNSSNKKGIEIGCKIIHEFNVDWYISGLYFFVKISSDGDSWNTYVSQANINWNSGTSIPAKVLPDTEIKFYPQYDKKFGYEIPSLENQTIPVNFAYSEPNLHIAIQKYNNVLYFLRNGSVISSISFTDTIYQSSNNLELTLGGIHETIFGKRGSESLARLGFGIKGVRVTNIARYSTILANTFSYDASLQPLALEVDKLAPARVRVIDIAKTDLNVSTASQSVSWIVYINNPVDSLVLADFTLVQLDGISGATLTSITELSDYEYRVVADSGIGNGSLTLNFLDRKTVKYKGTNNFISNQSGELNFEGDTYLINKAAPIPVLTSGSNPYVRNSFIVTISFIGAISEFNPENIGISNGFLVDSRIIDESNYIYQVTIEPIKDGVITIQALEGTGITATGTLSVKSNRLVRIYSESFDILQLPLNTSVLYGDFSPNRLELEEIVPNTTQFSNVVYPLGTSSSLDVNPLLEQGGLKYDNLDSIGSLITEELSTDWTIEFYLRINSKINNKVSHILSVENASTGFCIVANDGNLRVQRTISNSTNIFSSITIKDIDTPTFVEWTNNAYSQIQKYPHFAISKKGNTYRFYRNGIRQEIIQSDTPIDITKGDLYVGYYPNRVNDNAYYLSNVRLTYGKALYTAYQVNIPSLPYSVMPNIIEETELLSYISIYSSNSTSSVAITGDTITLKFTSILPLAQTPVVHILGSTVGVTVGEYNSYTATYTVLESDLDQEIPFSIAISNQPGIPNATFTQTTNNSQVFVDNSPLEVSITTLEPNNTNPHIEVIVGLTEPCRGITVDNFTVTNGFVSNLIKYSDISYSLELIGSSNGEISVKIDAGQIEDLAGNSNLVSNTLTRDVIIPSYSPDVSWDNVLLLIQPTSNSIVDLSDYGIGLTVNNVEISTVTSPSGLAKSLYFNGVNSSINFSLNQNLPNNIDYTIEFYLYINKSSILKLNNPTALPASNITTDSFSINWSEVSEADNYLLDISTLSNFSNYVPGYKNKIVDGSLTTLDISSGITLNSPKLKETELVGSKGFIPEWEYNYPALVYSLDVALDEEFTKPLYSYTDRVVELKYLEVGNIDQLEKVIPPSGGGDGVVDNSITGGTGTLMTGLLTNANNPKLYYVLDESSIRLYKNDAYSMPAIAEDIDAFSWIHIAICNTTKYTYLYIDGKQEDKIRNVGFSTDFDLGYSIGRFTGYLQSLRITKGVCRYTSDFNVPTLPLPIS